MVSVIIPTYNGEQTIEAAILSILYQDVENEILICDDCSTDKTMDIIKKYKVRRFINSYHTGGANAGRNRGIKEARGEFIAFLDQDDIFLPGKLKRQLKLIKDVDLCYSIPLQVNPFEKETYIYKQTSDYKKRDLFPSSILMKNNNVPLFEDIATDFTWSLKVLKNRKTIQTEPNVYRTKIGLSKNTDYRILDFRKALDIVINNKARRNVYGTLARHYFRIKEYKNAIKYFKKSRIQFKTLAYLFLCIWKKERTVNIAAIPFIFVFIIFILILCVEC